MTQTAAAITPDYKTLMGFLVRRFIPEMLQGTVTEDYYVQTCTEMHNEDPATARAYYRDRMAFRRTAREFRQWPAFTTDTLRSLDRELRRLEKGIRNVYRGDPMASICMDVQRLIDPYNPDRDTNPDFTAIVINEIIESARDDEMVLDAKHVDRLIAVARKAGYAVDQDEEG